MRFFLGTHVISFFEKTSVPLFVSRSQLEGYVNPPRAAGPWALDSGGFTQIYQFGHWTISPEDYVDQVRFWRRQVGNLDWSAQMDFMCEPHILLRAMVYEGLLPGIREDGPNTMRVIQNRYGRLGEKFKDRSLLMERVCVHQERTIANLIRLRELAPDVHFMPVLQGWTAQDYIAHADAWMRAGVDLTKEPIVGLGSVCRREKLDVAQAVISTLTGGDWRLRLHGFGLKNDAFEDPIVARGLASADSLAWSYMARYGTDMIDDPDRPAKKLKAKLCGHEHPKNDADYTKAGCTNCLYWALQWRRKALSKWEETVLGEKRTGKAANPGSNDEYVLAAPGEARQIGPEDGDPIDSGIALFISTLYPGSYRYVYYLDGAAVAGLHVMSRDGESGRASWVYVKPEYRRRGLATALIEAARQQFALEHGGHLTDDGRRLSDRLGIRENPDDDLRGRDRDAAHGDPIAEYEAAHQRWRSGQGPFHPPLTMDVIDGHGGFTALTSPAYRVSMLGLCSECGGPRTVDGREVVDLESGKICQSETEHRAYPLFDKNSLWRPASVLKQGTSGMLIAKRDGRFYQQNNNVVQALYAVPGYRYHVSVWFDKTTGERQDGGRRMGSRENPRESLEQVDKDLTDVVLMNVRPGRNVVSPVGGRAGYFIVSSDAQAICAVRHSTGKEVCVSTRRAVEVGKRILTGEKIPVRGIDYTVAKETLIYFALTGIVERSGKSYRRATEWSSRDLEDRFGVDLWRRITSWASESRRKNPMPVGDCFGWALSEVVNNGGVLMHGLVKDPWDGKRVSHGWVERDGLVYDYQTVVIRQVEPLSIEKFYSVWNPRDIIQYTQEEAAIQAASTGQAGPWSNPPPPERLYHLTPAKNLDSIREHGLDPGEAGEEWIYLAADGLHAAGYDAKFQGQEVVLFSVSVDDLDGELLGPDDVDLQAVLNQEPEVAEEHDGKDFWRDYDWRESLEISGQCTYGAAIPWNVLREERRWVSKPDEQKNIRANLDFPDDIDYRDVLQEDDPRYRLLCEIAQRAYEDNIGAVIPTEFVTVTTEQEPDASLSFVKPIDVIVTDAAADSIVDFGATDYDGDRGLLVVEWPVRLYGSIKADLKDPRQVDLIHLHMEDEADWAVVVAYAMLPSGDIVVKIMNRDPLDDPEGEEDDDQDD
jgi:GNAT superfamily N-acetyltransferase